MDKMGNYRRSQGLKTFWGMAALDLGDRLRTNIKKLHLQPGKRPSYSLNGKLLRYAQRENVRIEVCFPTRDNYIVSMAATEALKGRKELRPSQFIGAKDMDFYWYEVPQVFPVEGKKKELYQHPDQESLFV